MPIRTQTRYIMPGPGTVKAITATQAIKTQIRVIMVTREPSQSATAPPGIMVMALTRKIMLNILPTWAASNPRSDI